MTRTVTDDARLMEAVSSQRHELGVLLGDLPAEAWDRMSLCAGWRVRHVVAHMTMPLRYSTRRFITEMIKARGNFERMADHCARRDGADPPDELLSALRENAENPWTPPGGDLSAALTHDVIHGLDITVALGIEHPFPEERLRIVLDAITTPKSIRHFGVDLGGIELRANDIDWSYGSGSSLSGSARDLALVLCARQLPAGRLRGESAEFTEDHPIAAHASQPINCAPSTSE